MRIVRWNRFDSQSGQQLIARAEFVSSVATATLASSAASSHDYGYCWCVSVFQSIWLNRICIASMQYICHFVNRTNNINKKAIREMKEAKKRKEKKREKKRKRNQKRFKSKIYSNLDKRHSRAIKFNHKQFTRNFYASGVRYTAIDEDAWCLSSLCSDESSLKTYQYNNKVTIIRDERAALTHTHTLLAMMCLFYTR